MRQYVSDIKIPLDSLKGICLCIFGNSENTLAITDPETAAEAGESRWQLFEGCFYNYYFEKDGADFSDVQIRENAVVKKSLRKGKSEGRISPNVYVGSLPLDIIDIKTGNIAETVYLEVLPTKLDEDFKREPDRDYRENYEFMLGDIAEKCTELLLQAESPVYQNFEPDFTSDAQTVYQRFAFIRSILNNDEFNESVLKVISSPTSRWTSVTEETDVYRIGRIDRRTARELVSGGNRIKTTRSFGKLDSLPTKIENSRKTETYDTHENRFVKHVIGTLLQFTRECEEAFRKKQYEKSRTEAAALAEMLESHLNHSFFTDISRPTVLKLNSPALQRKSGYREILNIWLKFDLSVRLIWKGGDDVYKAGKRDIAVLYEYWLFFCLYNLVRDKFKISDIYHQNGNQGKSYSHLIVPSADNMQLLLKSGKETALQGIYEEGNWKFNIRFSYNKTFNVSRTYSQGKEGSWTKPLRPDYTLSIWPEGITPGQAEKEEQIVHIHFDSKYKVRHFTIPDTVENGIAESDDISDELLETDSLTREKRDELKGVYKNADLVKMHAYKDAIRRTGGAYILYPGTENQVPLRGFHEIIPGLGAFAIRPQKAINGVKAAGTEDLSRFIDDVIDNFRNSASQQKKYAAKTYDTFSNGPSFVQDPLPYGIIPDETFVIVGYCRDQANIDGFYEKHGLYNFRMDDDRGSIELSANLAKAKYLLLREKGKNTAGRIYKITGNGPRVFSGEKLKQMGYLSSDLKDYYLVFSIEKEISNELGINDWNFKNLSGYRKLEKEIKDPFILAGKPFLTNLTELMLNK